MPRTKKERHKLCKALLEKNIKEKKRLYRKYLGEKEFQDFDAGYLSRPAYSFMDLSGTKKADKRNREYLRLISTRKGQARFSKEILNHILAIDLSVFYSQDPDVIIDYAKKNFAVLFAAFESSFMSCLRFPESGISKDALEALSEIMPTIQLAGGIISSLESYASDTMMEDDYEGLGAAEITEKLLTNHPDAMKIDISTGKTKAAAFISYGKYNDDLNAILQGMEKLKEQKIELKKLGDLLKYKFFDEKGNPVKAGMALELWGSGKQLRVEEKTREELIPVAFALTASEKRPKAAEVKKEDLVFDEMAIDAKDIPQPQNPADALAEKLHGYLQNTRDEILLVEGLSEKGQARIYSIDDIPPALKAGKSVRLEGYKEGEIFGFGYAVKMDAKTGALLKSRKTVVARTVDITDRLDTPEQQLEALKFIRDGLKYSDAVYVANSGKFDKMQKALNKVIKEMEKTIDRPSEEHLDKLQELYKDLGQTVSEYTEAKRSSERVKNGNVRGEFRLNIARSLKYLTEEAQVQKLNKTYRERIAEKVQDVVVL